jgi:hypothetical protein
MVVRCLPVIAPIKSIQEIRMRLLKIVLAWLLAATLAGCGNDDSPETQVRKTIDAIEQAAEERNVSGLTDHISGQFLDGDGRNGKELSQYVRGYFIANQSIHLLTRIESVEFPTRDEAKVKVTVAMVGRDADAANAWNLAGEIYDFDVTFMREDDEWKVTYAKWRRPGG